MFYVAVDAQPSDLEVDTCEHELENCVNHVLHGLQTFSATRTAVKFPDL